jgi:hypothetical protein
LLAELEAMRAFFTSSLPIFFRPPTVSGNPRLFMSLAKNDFPTDSRNVKYHVRQAFYQLEPGAAFDSR